MTSLRGVVLSPTRRQALRALNTAVPLGREGGVVVGPDTERILTEAWAHRTCETVSKELWQFADEHCVIKVLSDTCPGVCVVPGAEAFHIVLKEYDEKVLFHELAHVFLGHNNLSPPDDLRGAQEEAARALGERWHGLWLKNLKNVGGGPV